MSVTTSNAASRVIEGGAARYYAKHEARRTAEEAARFLDAPVGVWLDSLGFIVSRMSNPITRSDVTLVIEAKP